LLFVRDVNAMSEATQAGLLIGSGKAFVFRTPEKPTSAFKQNSVVSYKRHERDDGSRYFFVFLGSYGAGMIFQEEQFREFFKPLPIVGETQDIGLFSSDEVDQAIKLLAAFKMQTLPETFEEEEIRLVRYRFEKEWVFSHLERRFPIEEGLVTLRNRGGQELVLKDEEIALKTDDINAMLARQWQQKE
jgi:hypothetical protein